MAYGEHHGKIAFEWNGLSAPSSAHHGWVEIEVGTYYSSSFNYGQDTYVEVTKALAHNDFWLSAVRAVDYGSTVRIQVQVARAVSTGTFRSFVLHKNQGTVTSLTPAINNNTYTVLASANVGEVDGDYVQKAVANRVRFSKSVAFDEKVGIGTTAPSTKLYVDGGDSTFNRGNTDGAIARFRGKNAEKAVIGTADSWFSSSVGIGTTAPRVKLHVQGGVGIFNVSDSWHQSSQGTNILRGGGFNSSISEESTAVKIFNSSGVTGKAVGNYWGGISFIHLDPEYSTWGSSFQGDHFWIGGRLIDTPAQERSALVFAVNSASTAGTHSSEKMVILPNGNVGIGTTSPGAKLHVQAGDIRVDDSTNGTVRGLYIRHSGITGNVTSLVQDTSGSPKAHLKSSERSVWISAQSDGDGSSTETLRLYNNQNLGLVVDYSGNVGIGTTSPTAKLDVRATSGYAVMIANGDVGTGTNNRVQLRLSYNGTDDYSHFITTRHNSSSSLNNAIDFYTSDSTQNGVYPNNATHGLTIEAGRVGIGTTSPAGKLDIRSGALFVGDYTGVVTPTDGIWLERPAGNSTQIQMYTTGASIFNIFSDGTTANIGWASGADREVNFQNTGAGTIKVGIGTGSPDQLLHTVGGTVKIESDGSNASGAILELKHANNNTTDVCATINFTNNIGGYAAIEGGTTGANNTGYLAFKTDNAGTQGEAVRILGNGNVGIGTTSPSEKLTVYATSARLSVTGGSGTAAILIGNQDSAGANNPSAIYAGNGSLYLGGGTSWSGGGTLSAALTVLDGGNVGIGTTSPSEKLEVNGNISLTANNSYLHINRATTASDGLLVYKTAGANRWLLGAWGNTNETFYLYSYGVGGPVLVSDYTTGNIGIGTTSPAYKLDVSGGAIAIRGNAAGNSLRFDDSGGTSRNAIYLDTSNYLNVGNTNYSGIKLYHTVTAPDASGFEGSAVAEAFGNTENGKVLAEPAAWLAVRVGTTDYAIPMYATG